MNKYKKEQGIPYSSTRDKLSRFVPLDKLLKLTLLVRMEIAHHVAQFFNHALVTRITVFTAIPSHAVTAHRTPLLSL